MPHISINGLAYNLTHWACFCYPYLPKIKRACDCFFFFFFSFFFFFKLCRHIIVYHFYLFSPYSQCFNFQELSWVIGMIFLIYDILSSKFYHLPRTKVPNFIIDLLLPIFFLHLECKSYFSSHYLRFLPKHPIIHDISIHLLGITAINKHGIQSFESSHLSPNSQCIQF